MPKNVRINIPNKENLSNFDVTISVLSGFWAHASFLFSFEIDDHYPYKSPKVICETKVYHPNIDLQGNISLNILENCWHPIITIGQIINGLMYLFDKPNPTKALNQSAADIMKNDIKQFKINVNKSITGGNVDGIQY